MHENNQSTYHIALAVALAVLCHVLALILLSRAQWQPEIERRVPMTLIVESSIEPESTQSEHQHSDQPQTVSSMNSESPIVFRVPDSLPERPRNLTSPSSDTSWIGKLFSSQSETRSQDIDETSPQEEVTQVVKNNLPILGPYHVRLIQILARSRYHDQQYDFESLERPQRVVLKLKLHASGALLRVSVELSSGDAALDAAAQRSAYAASPFPPPPESDASFSYTYPVEIQYQPRAQH